MNNEKLQIVLNEINSKIKIVEKSINDIKILQESIPTYIEKKLDPKTIYVEMSFRQSGKTKRMLHDICNELDSGNKKICVFAPNVKMLSYLKGSFKQSVRHTIQYFNNIDVLRTLNADKIYFDEFDFINNINSIELRNNMYFCSSPAFIRTKDILMCDDILTKFIKNNIKIVNYTTNIYDKHLENGIYVK
jgi:hypothetical protein